MKVTFHINFHTVWGQRICIVGSIPELGSWEPALAKEMSYVGDGNWRYELDLPDDTGFIEYRYLLSVEDKQIFEEWERNHRMVFDDNSKIYTLYDYWQTRPDNLAFYSSAFTQSFFAHPCNTHERVVKGNKKIVIKVSCPRVERNQSLAITGNQAVLGNWHPGKALLLSCDTFPEWHIDLDADEIRTPLEYKFVIWDNDTLQPVHWETGENRTLNLPALEEGETITISGLYFRDDLPKWRCVGTVIPVFSLRSENSFGVGDLGDLRLLVDWVKQTEQRIIQVLPMNDTTMSHTWRDSYPYSAISIYALHPMYISLSNLGALNDSERMAFYASKQMELNAKDSLDYEATIKYKMDYCREFFEQEGEAITSTPDYKEFVRQNEYWLKPYATYCFLRDMYGTSDFSQWEGNTHYVETRVRALYKEESEAWPEISLSLFIQYILHVQFKEVSDYARKNRVVLKGDLPIGINRTSVEAWTEPKYFNMNGQAGAPPDDFSLIGQNWKFPTYNWDVMEQDNFAWWKRRFKKLEDYFDCFRIDHILGFFRIWEIPVEYEQGLCGHFNPALPLTKEDIEQYGLPFDEDRFTMSRINGDYLHDLFGELTDNVIDSYLAQSTAQYFVLKSFCDTQQKIASLFEGKTDDVSIRLRNGLFAIANEVLFLKDPVENWKFHPRISASLSYIYRELNGSERYAFDQLYWDFFYHRHNYFWKSQALKRLTPLINSTRMLVCGEDLGMIPQSVPEVMNKLQILSLEIERMPKESNREFSDLANLPYLSVCTTSTHDMSPIRNWWKEDYGKIQRYYNQVLQHPGEAPQECPADLAAQIVSNHLKANSMLTIIPLQDWFATDDSVRRQHYDSERINIPADPSHYWRYRMHITLEQLLQNTLFNEKVVSLIKEAGRK